MAEGLATQGRLRASFGHTEMLEFAPGDTGVLLTLRNHPAVRKFMPKPEPLDRQAHLAWVAANLRQGGPLRIFVVRCRGLPAGFTVLKTVDAETLEIGVVMAEAQRHPGLPAQCAVLMMHLCFAHWGASRVVSHVNTGHARALALNRAFGTETRSAKPNELCFECFPQPLGAHWQYRRLLERVKRSLQIDWLDWP